MISRSHLLPAGDLDPQTSKHTLVPLKIAYKKLRLLVDLGVVEQFVDLVGVEGAFHEEARHDGDRAALDEPLEDLAEEHDRGPEGWNVTRTVPTSYCGGRRE